VTTALLLVLFAGTVNALSFSVDQQLLFSASSDSTVRLWSTELRKGLAAYRCGSSTSRWSAELLCMLV
jgi:WD40 repeat protein